MEKCKKLAELFMEKCKKQVEKSWKSVILYQFYSVLMPDWVKTHYLCSILIIERKLYIKVLRHCLLFLFHLVLNIRLKRWP